MQKKRVWFLSFLFLPLISAYYSGYNNFSLDNLFASIDSQALLYAGVFLVIFVLVNYPLAKIFRDNKATSPIIAGVIASFVVYGVYTTGWDLERFFSNLGIEGNILYWIVGILAFIVIIWTIKRVGIGLLLTLIGLIITILPFIFEDIEQKGTMLIIGPILLILGLIAWAKFRKKSSRETAKEAENKESELSKLLRLLAEYRSKGDTKRMTELERRVRHLQEEIQHLRQEAVTKRKEEIKEEQKKVARKEEEAQKSIYKAMMRRGGEKNTRGRFVSKKAVDRYARRFGEETAKKRFDKK